MMTANNLHPKHSTKQETQTTTTKKQTTTTTPNTRPQQDHHHQLPLKCPRCDSPNTKFCYYNNYSLAQPRHFCKTCRRYWTKGGALRNIPIGGGCRKNKKLKVYSSSSSRLSGGGDSKEYSTGSSVDFACGLKLSHGLSPVMDFNLGGLSFPRLNNPSLSGGVCNHFSSLGDQIPSSSAGVNVTSTAPSGFSLDLLSAGSSGAGGGPLLGYHNYLNLSSVTNGFTDAIQEGGVGGSMDVHTSLASSIESLSSINQDMHWKLQQQRLAMLFGAGEDQNKEIASVNRIHDPPPQAQKLQPILFQNLEISSSKPEVSCVGDPRKDGASSEMATEWFFGNSYGRAAASAATPTNSNSNGNDGAGNWNSGVQASWCNLHQYNYLR